MANIYTNELYGNLLPRVLFNKITLESRSSGRFLNVSLNLVIKQEYNNDIAGKWFQENDFKKYLKIKVIQVTDARIASIFSFTKDAFLLLDPYFKNDRGLVARSPVQSLMIKVLDARDINEVKDLMFGNYKLGIRAQVTEQDLSLQIPEQTKFEVLDDGTEVYNIYTKLSFPAIEAAKIASDVGHLSYFCLAYFDTQKLIEDFSLTDTSELRRYLFDLSNVTSEIVIDDFKIKNETYVFLDQDSKIWVGDVNIDNKGNYYSGLRYVEGESIPLIRRTVQNSTIQDFRSLSIKAPVRILQPDYSKFEKVNSFSGQTLSAGKGSYFSPLEITVNKKFDRTNENIFYTFSSFSFSIDIKSLILENSKYNFLVENYNSSLASAIMSQQIFVGMKLFRQRVKEVKTTSSNRLTVQKSYEKFSKNEIKNVLFHGVFSVASAGQLVNDDKLYLRASRIENGVMQFSVTDTDSKNLSDGIYQYSLELQIKDPIDSFLQNEIFILNEAKQKFKQYLLKAQGSVPVSGKDGTRKLTPYYNSFLDSFIEQFKKQNSQSYVSNYKPSIDLYVTSIKRFFTLSEEDSIALASDLVKTTSPQTGNIVGITSFINLLDQLISNLNFILGQSRNDGYLSSSTTKRKERTVIDVSHVFKDSVFDADMEGKLVVEYINSNARSDVVQTGGLTTLTVEEYDQRIQQETNNFYLSETPSVQNLFGDEVQNPQLTFNNNSYSLLTPFAISYGATAVETIPTNDRERVSLTSNMLAAARVGRDIVSKNSLTAEDFVNDVFSRDLQERYNLNISFYSIEDPTKNRRRPSPRSLGALPVDEPDQKREDVKEEVITRFGNIPKEQKDPLGALVSVFSAVGKDNKSVNRRDAKENLDKNTRQGKKAPNQTRALLAGNLNADNRKEELPQKTLDNFTKATNQEDLYMGSAKEVQYRVGFEQDEKGRSIMNAPIWETLTKERATEIPLGAEVLCRVTDYQRQDMSAAIDITKDNEITNRVFVLTGQAQVPSGVGVEPEVETKLGDIPISVDRAVAETTLRATIEQAQVPPETTTSNPVSPKPVAEIAKQPEVQQKVTNKQSQRVRGNSFGVRR
jgi:hypothetical protein